MPQIVERIPDHRNLAVFHDGPLRINEGFRKEG